MSSRFRGAQICCCKGKTDFIYCCAVVDISEFGLGSFEVCGHHLIGLDGSHGDNSGRGSISDMVYSRQ